MSERDQVYGREKLTILGEVDAASFIPWISRHCAKLGIRQSVAFSGPDRVEIEIAGPLALRDALEAGCSLGPCDVWVDKILRQEMDEDKPV